jgi:hypothetical protein
MLEYVNVLSIIEEQMFMGMILCQWVTWSVATPIFIFAFQSIFIFSTGHHTLDCQL